MKMMKRELWIMPLVIIILSFSIFILTKAVNYPILNMLIPQEDKVYEFIKIYFTAFLLIYIGGIFFDTNKIDNYLLSRVASLTVIIVINICCYQFCSKYGNSGLIILMVVSIWIGQYVSYTTQNLGIRNSDILAILMQTIIAYLIFVPDILFR